MVERFSSEAAAYRGQLARFSGGLLSMVVKDGDDWVLVPAQRCGVCRRLNEQFVEKCVHCGDLLA